MAASIDLSVIIVNWNSAELVRKCLTSLVRQRAGLSMEVIVIDNDSRDECGEMVARDFPEVTFIQGDNNVGFGRANNMAFAKSNGRLLLFLNPDTEVSETAIERMTAVFRKFPDAGVVGARLLNSDLSVQTSCIQRFPTAWNIVLDSGTLRTLFPRSSLWGTRPLLDRSNVPVAVDAISGACQMIRRDVFQRAGLYNAAYFMYAEDIDLCRAVMDLGFRNYYVGEAIVMHHGGKSSNVKDDSGRVAVIMRESWKRYFELHRGRSYAVAFKFAVALQAVSRLVLITLGRLFVRDRDRRHKLRVAESKWTSILRWTVGLESWAGRLGGATKPCAQAL